MADTIAQRQAIEFKGNDLLISAAAGSGKTTTLIKRIVENVKKGADVSRLLIVTFTNAAANELRTRLTVKLSEALSENKGSAHLKEQVIKAGSADVCTIDAFCLKLLRANFDKVGIDRDMRIGEESELNVLRREVMEDVIDSFYEKPEADPDFLAVCDCFGDVKNEEALAEALLDLNKSLSSTWESTDFLLKNSKIEGDFIDTPFGKIITDYVRTVVDRYEGEYEDVYRECLKDEKTVKCYLPAIDGDLALMKTVRQLLKSRSYNEIKSGFEGLKFISLKSVKGECASDVELIKSVRNDFKAEIEEIRKKWLNLDIKAIETAYDLNAKMCRSIHRVLKIYESELEKRKKAYSIFEFNDVERYALKILYKENGEISDVAREYSEKYDEIYIDEYQDTNSVQDKIFSAIARKNRFMVGDIKQSIYKFRSAEPEIFASYRNSFTPYGSHSEDSNGVSIFMSNNFRSDKGVIDFSNLVSDYTFKSTRAIPYDENDSLIFSRDVPNGYPHEKAEVYFINSDTEDEDEAVSEDKGYNPEAEFVAKKIKTMLDDGYLPSGEKIKPEHIAILLRTRTRLRDYIEALNRQGVDYEYLNEDRFYEKSEILFMLCLLNSIDSPSRDAYFTGALRSHLFGFTLAELVKIRKASSQSPSMYASCKAYEKDDEIRRKLDCFFEKIEKYREECRKLSAHQIISMLYADLGLLSGCSVTERKNLIKLYDIARRYEGASYKGLSAFLRYVDKASADTVRESVGEKIGESVQIMTVHASKGLEYPICFLCDTGARFLLKDLTKPLLFERRVGVCGIVSRDGGLVKYDTLIRKCAAMAIRNGLCEEEMRKLYVALTRAKNKLIVTAKVKNPVKYLEKMKQSAAHPSEHALLKTLKVADFIAGACAEQKDFYTLNIIDGENDMESCLKKEENETYFSEDEALAIEKILRKRFEFKYEKEYLNKIPSKLSVSKLTPTVLDGTENEEIDQNISIDTLPAFLNGGSSKRTGAEIGTATHLFMQFCDFDSLEKNGAEFELARLYERGFISETVRDLVNIRHIESFAKSELFKSLKAAKWIKREFRFNVFLDASEFSADAALSDERVLVQGVIDCLYENENGDIVLVDYKTDSVNEENYRSVLLSRHKNQLSYYKKACEMMLDREISQVLLYSIPVSKSVEIKFKEEK
ncbi:MAG: helicase-exonuclease AddAB subunit AddA [Clostridia bacterium]|nr:helicase-exonuclease AddAB subunit AddA [Clostridia bacterium]